MLFVLKKEFRKRTFQIKNYLHKSKNSWFWKSTRLKSASEEIRNNHELNLNSTWTKQPWTKEYI